MDWHLLSEKEVIEELNSSINGLSREEADARLAKFGKNKIEKKKNFSIINIFLSQFKSFLILVLVFAAVLSFLMGSKVDSIVIIAIIILNSGIGFSQEFRAEKAIEDLKKMLVSYANVIRGGKLLRISSYKLVPGDIISVSSGDKIPADARLIEVNNLKVNEASLTGESFPEEKISTRLEFLAPLADRINMIYCGTEIISGSARAIVVDTGVRTEIGKISSLVQEVKSDKNPFKKKLDDFAVKIGIIVFVLCIFIVGLLVVFQVPLLHSLLVAVSIAVSAIPEGLPAVVSLGLAFATRRMIGKNVLIRKLNSSETLGRVSIICTDKTGTLTEEKMKVSSIYVNGKLNPEKGKEMLLRIGLLCNNSRVEKDDNGKKYYVGDPTETALIEAGENDFFDKKKLCEQEQKIKVFEFNSNRKMMSIVRKSDKKLISYVKGAPEEIIKKCSFEIFEGKRIKLGENEKQRLVRVYEDMAKKGLRVLGFAYKTIPVYSEITEKISEENLIFVGFMGMIDPPRADVKNAVKLCQQAGIKVIMVTGDSQITAEAVAREIGIHGKTISGLELERLSDRDLYNQINETGVFSRISPEDKLRIVNVLKQRNEIVAMTGDGVNDSLALKRADVGVAMGIRGSDVSKDSSDIILVDDNFSSIVEGVKEGRRIYDNIRKSIKYLLAANFFEMFFILLVILIWRDPNLLPLLPLQILWINLVTDSLPALALTTENAEDDLMKRKLSTDGLLNGMSHFIFFAGIIGVILLSVVFIMNIDNIDKARTMVVTTSILYQMFLAFNCKSRKSVFKSKINKNLFYAVIVSVAVHILLVYSPLNSVFGLINLGLNDWMIMIGVCLAGFFVMELSKIGIKRHSN